MFDIASCHSHTSAAVSTDDRMLLLHPVQIPAACMVHVYKDLVRVSLVSGHAKAFDWWMVVSDLCLSISDSSLVGVWLICSGRFGV